MSSTDTQSQESLGIRYDHVSSPDGLNEEEVELLAEMRLQLEYRGNGPPTRAFVQNLGNWSDGQIIDALNSKRKRVSAEDDLAISNLAPLPNPNASTTSHRTYHAPSPPPLEDLLPSPSMANTVPYSHPPALNITHPQPQVQRQQSQTLSVTTSLNNPPKAKIRST